MTAPAGYDDTIAAGAAGRPVAITGAGGLIGSALCRRLASAGVEVVGLDIDPGARPRVEGAGARFVECDTRAATSARAALAGLPLVVHTAAIVSEWGPMDDFMRANVDGTRNVLDAADAHGAERVVHVSSVAAFGWEVDEEIAEDAEPRTGTGNPYFETKALSERVARERGATVVRPGDVYGPGSQQWSVRPLRLLRARMLALPARGRGLVTPVYIDDLVDCLVRALLHPEAAGRAFTAWEGRPVASRDFFGHYARMLGRGRVPVAPLPALIAYARLAEATARLTGRPPGVTRAALRYLCRRAAYSTTQARGVLGWEPRVDLDEGMRRTEAWFRDIGLLGERGTRLV